MTVQGHRSYFTSVYDTQYPTLAGDLVVLIVRHLDKIDHIINVSMTWSSDDPVSICASSSIDGVTHFERLFTKFRFCFYPNLVTRIFHHGFWLADCCSLAGGRQLSYLGATPLAQLTHWGRDTMDAISQTTISNVFSWKMCILANYLIKISILS